MTLDKDYHAARIATAKKVSRTYGSTSSRGLEKPYNELLDRLQDASMEFAKDRNTRLFMHKLAWFLGMNGETDACEVIMSKSKEPVSGYYGYGVY